MPALIHDLPFDPATLPGLSEKLLRSHHQNNYAGAVKRLNAIRGELASLPVTTAPGYQLNGLKREELVATNSMLLHELYFGSLGGGHKDMVPAMALALSASFGSAQRWRDEFVAMGKALGGGSGWVLLSFQPRDGALVNQWAADHTHEPDPVWWTPRSTKSVIHGRPVRSLATNRNRPSVGNAVPLIAATALALGLLTRRASAARTLPG